MDTRTGDIYDSREAALAAGVPDEHIVTGERAALEQMAEAIRSKRGAFFATHTEQVALAAQQAGIDFAEATAEAERKARRKKPSASDLELAERIQADVETPNPLTSE